MKMPGSRVRFLVQDKPSGDLAARRKHARRITPYPTQMQALIDAQLLTADYYEEHRERRGAEQDVRDDEAARLLAAERPHVLAELWRKVVALLHCV